MKKGNIEKRDINSFRLSYTYNYKKHTKTIKTSNKRESAKYLKIWVKEIEKNYTYKKYYNVKAFSKLWLEKQIFLNSTLEMAVTKYQSFFDNCICQVKNSAKIKSKGC